MQKEKIIKVRVPKPLRDYFDKIKRDTGISVSEQIRDGLKFYLMAVRSTFNPKEIDEVVKSLEEEENGV